MSYELIHLFLICHIKFLKLSLIKFSIQNKSCPLHRTWFHGYVGHFNSQHPFKIISDIFFKNKWTALNSQSSQLVKLHVSEPNTLF